MLRDIRVMMRKELTEILRAGGLRRGPLTSLAVYVGVFGVALPLSQRELWTGTPFPALLFAMLPLFAASPIVADGFAGERERGTLETLLATRLPDSAIYLGKILSVTVYAWGLTLLAMAASVVSLGAAAGELVLYPAVVWFGGIAGSFLAGILVSAAGTLVSLRAETVRAAQQMLTLPLMVLVFGFAFGVPALAGRLSPERRRELVEWALGLSPWLVAGAALAALTAAAALLTAIGMARFRRSRLLAE